MNSEQEKEASKEESTPFEAHPSGNSSPVPEQAEGTPETRQRVITPSFAQMLLDAGILSAEQVEIAQEAARRERVPLGQILVRDGFVVSRDLATLTALHLGLPMVDLRGENIEPSTVTLLPAEIARRYLVLPIRQSEDRLTVAMTDPTDYPGLDH